MSKYMSTSLNQLSIRVIKGFFQKAIMQFDVTCREDNLHIKHHLLNISRKKQVKIVWQSILLVILNFLYNTIKYDINTLMDAMHSEISLWRAFTIRPGCLQVSFSTKILIKHSGSCSLQRNVIDS